MGCWVFRWVLQNHWHFCIKIIKIALWQKKLNVKKKGLTIPLFINLLDKLWMHFYAKIIPILINQEWIWSQKYNTNSSIIMFYYNSNCINLIWQHFLSVSRVIQIVVFLVHNPKLNLKNFRCKIFLINSIIFSFLLTC